MSADTRSAKPRPSRPRGALLRITRLFMAARGRQLLLGCLLSSATALMGCALLGLSGWFITATALAGLAAGSALMFDVFTPSASIRLLSLGRTAARYAERLVTHEATLDVLAHMRRKLFLGWAQPEAARELLLRPARVLFRLTRDLDALESLYLRLLAPAFVMLACGLLLGIFTSFVHAWLGLAFGGFFGLASLLAAWWMARRSTRTAARYARGLERLRAATIDLVAGQTDLLMAQQMQRQQTRIRQLDDSLRKTDSALNRTDIMGGALYSAMQSVAVAGALLLGAWLYQRGSASLPVAVMLVLLALAAAEPFAGLRRGALEAGRTRLAARRLAQPLEAADAPAASTAAAQRLPEPGFALQIQHLQHAYPLANGNSLTVLQEVSLALRAGEHVALVGASGCGKSTLLALIAGDLAVRQGALSGVPAVSLTQRTELFQDTVRGNLLLGRTDIDDDALWAALHAAGLAPDIRQSAGGLDTRLGEGGLGLSGGQARRLALARLFLARQDFWLLDEPSESLDTATAADVLQKLAQNAKHKTLLIATHLRREALLAERILLMQQGKIIHSAHRDEAAYAQITGALRSG